MARLLGLGFVTSARTVNLHNANEYMQFRATLEPIAKTL